ncbi:amidase [Aureimonas sp. SA4125]|uniref:amidase n=1 Tax=Aureimonas sp. SA4125 TaxID=2826993 RepID=UPI001CC690B8|nr:amidase [Aureimonas sp. SA4125]BDA84122.1 amidase [Aureimonas sp. SA4125]
MLLDDTVGAFLPYPAVPVVSAKEGVLAGLRLGVKDLYDVAGYRTGCGSPFILAASAVKTRTAPSIQKLLDAGATFVGKTQTDELAWSLFGMNPHFGTPVNSAAPDRIPGGSSSGSAAAVAANLVDIGIGSDTGGSVRAPASFCGLWSFRPSHGRISLDGCMALAESFDTLGFFSRDAATLTKTGAVLLGDDSSPLPASPRLLRAGDMFARMAGDARAVLDEASAGIPAPDVDVYAGLGAETVYDAFRILQAREILRAFGPWIDRVRPALGSAVAARFAYARSLTDEQEETADGVRARFRAAIDALLGEDGVLIAPAVHDAPFRLDAGADVHETFRRDAITLLSVAGLAGLPQVTLPAGRANGGPIGLSLIGPRGSDASLIALATRLFVR